MLVPRNMGSYLAIIHTISGSGDTDLSGSIRKISDYLILSQSSSIILSKLYCPFNKNSSKNRVFGTILTELKLLFSSSPSSGVLIVGQISSIVSPPCSSAQEGPVGFPWSSV